MAAQPVQVQVVAVKLLNKKNALILFAKAPIRGTVKTRLQPELTLDEALLLYKGMVEDLVSYLKDSDFDLKLFFWPPDSEKMFREWLGVYLDYEPQQGKDLGEKMHFAFQHIFKCNYNKVIIIGSDLPTLKKSIILAAFAELESSDLVLGPSPDGGYYLIGLQKARPELFENIVWSTNLVLKKTMDIARANNLKVKLLQTIQDIDTFNDVKKLNRFIKNHKKEYQHLEKTNFALKQILSDKK